MHAGECRRLVFIIVYFLAGNQLYKLTGEGGAAAADDEVKKSIVIIGYKQWLLSIDMKTKVVQLVKSVWMRELESVRAKVVQHVKSDWVRACECERVRLLSQDKEAKIGRKCWLN